MATIQYRIRATKAGRLSTIFMRVKDGSGVDITVPTYFKVFPEYWSNVKQTFKQRIIFTNNFSELDKNKIEDALRDLRNTLLKTCNQTTALGEVITKEWLKTTIDEFHNKKTGKETLNQFIERFINEIEAGQRFYDHNNRIERYKLGTIKNYKGFQEQFRLFQQEKGKQFDFEDINLDFYDQFVLYFTIKEYRTNTIGRHIKSLKVIMRVARDLGLHSNTEIDKKKFKSIKVDTDSIYLTEEEIRQIADLDLSKDRVLDITRDVFLIGCFTLQRYGDYSRYCKDDIRTLSNGTRVIDIIQEKTGQRVLIPLRPELIKLLEKYDYKLPKTYESKVNKRIKVIGEMAKITSPVTIESIMGGLKVKTSVAKNELIMTHTARRTGCTNMYLGGVNVLDIMKISGHKSEREFLKYIKVSNEETAQNLSLHPYFTQGSLKVV